MQKTCFITKGILQGDVKFEQGIAMNYHQTSMGVHLNLCIISKSNNEVIVGLEKGLFYNVAAKSLLCFRLTAARGGLLLW